jgi:hypothetical protein
VVSGLSNLAALAVPPLIRRFILQVSPQGRIPQTIVGKGAVQHNPRTLQLNNKRFQFETPLQVLYITSPNGNTNKSFCGGSISGRYTNLSFKIPQILHMKRKYFTLGLYFIISHISPYKTMSLFYVPSYSSIFV